MKQFSKKKLVNLNILGKILFRSEDTLKTTQDYIRNIARSKRRFEDSLISMEFDPQSDDFKELVTRIETSTVFRENKRLTKGIVSEFFFVFFMSCLISLPIIFPLVFMGRIFDFWEYVFIYVIYAVVSTINVLIVTFMLDYYRNFEIRIGTIGVNILGFISFVLICLPLYACSGMSETVLKAGLVSSFWMLYCAFGAFLLIRFCGEFLIDFLYYSKKIRITNALILDSTFKIARAKWEECLVKTGYKRHLMIEIERLAKLIESDLASHIYTGDPATTKWKSELMLAKANGIRAFKKDLINPGPESASKLKKGFNQIYKNIVKNNWEALPEDMNAVLNMKKKNFWSALRSFLVAFLPVSLVLSVKYFSPNAVPSSSIEIGLIVGTLWLIVSALIWLDPNLTDKLSTMKSVRSVFRGGQSEE